MTLKSIHCVRLDNRKVLRAPSPKAKYFERLFVSLIKLYINCKILNAMVKYKDYKIFKIVIQNI